MNARDFHLNDWVYAIETDGSDDTPNGKDIFYPVQVDTIFGDTIIDGYGVERDHDQLRPIPLTDIDIMKRFGFMEAEPYPKDKYNHSLLLGCISYQWSDDDTDGIEVNIRMKSRRIKYLHELQAFWYDITKEELELKYEEV